MGLLQKTPHFLWQPAAWLRVTGEDALTFLQGQLTNDLRNLMPGEGRYGLWLNQKGKVVADSFVVAAPEGAFFVGSYYSPAALIRERLEAFIIADDVAIEDETAAWRGVTVLADEPRETVAADLAGGVLLAGRRERSRHWEWVAPAAAVAAAVAAAGGEAVTADAMERRRIRAGVPAVPADVGPNDLPNEAGLDEDAISYTKGCYLGQEVMARLKAMGQVRRRLVRVSGPGAAPAVPGALFLGERSVGEVRSAVADGDGFIGLAMVSRLHVKSADARLALAVDVEPNVRLLEVP